MKINYFIKKDKALPDEGKDGNELSVKESFFGHFKEEFYVYYNPKTQEELYKNVGDFIEYYNNDRIQMRFKMSPNQYLKSNNIQVGFLSLST